MDALTDWLQMVTNRDVTLVRSHLTAPWGIGMEAGPTITFHLVTKGGCWLRASDGNAVELGAGDLVVVTDGRAHDIVDQPATKAVPSLMFSERMAPQMAAASANTTLICGRFEPDARANGGQLLALPGLLHLRATEMADNEAIAGILRLLALEVETPGAGSALLIRQLADSLLVYVLRAAAQRVGHAPNWLAAMQDHYLAKAFAEIHASPETDWTVEALAERAGLSRAAFSRRFTEKVGQPPLTYLTNWRMTLAAQILAAGKCPLAVVSGRVGYQSEAAFSRAFKRHHGVAPAAYRRAG